MTDSLDDTKQHILLLIDAIEKYGTVHHYHFRPVRECFVAGFCYAVGGLAATGCLIELGKGLVWAVGFIAGLVS
jgi:hypothetical protein